MSFVPPRTEVDVFSSAVLGSRCYRKFKTHVRLTSLSLVSRLARVDANTTHTEGESPMTCARVTYSATKDCHMSLSFGGCQERIAVDAHH